ncbi:helix-turn-helix domain-containing protein [Aminobacter sp. J44]|uniref:helix-turn-helix domain-containing protein n=1 Tax=Aminobacter sp. J44 TaxID=935262 RepID=UPI00119ACE71|nr:helix-turn-helix transcriptional regulator [Aminobacter sp. J44]TWG65242.1 transcriptional regulator with XRE-family HTH domain [Aminobacter sp. J44]
MEQLNAGALIREWRQRRRLSQLDLALDAEISQRHLSFIESGRARPSRGMVLRLAEQMDVPLRQRNRLLMAAGYAPSFGERELDDPALKPALAAVEQVLIGHEPFPAIAVDKGWNMLKANASVGPLLESIEDLALLEPPVNVLRLSLHPKGLAPRIVNLGQWRTHLLERLRLQIENSGGPGLQALEKELLSYPGPAAAHEPDAAHNIAVPLRVRMGDQVLSFISTITVFGTPLDVTLSELAIESFFPADTETGDYLRQLATAT